MERILVVEDDTSQLEIRRQILEHAGYEVVTAQDATQALERWQGCPIVVMDLRIPEPEDGVRLIEAIAGQARIIVLSGGQVDPTLPVDEFLTKPFPSKRLLESIRKWATSESK
ncbi:MAG TPA: response regulator [Bryobacteraceae bacterium]|jgi:CheY-like chemotaxis protein|nr:response regulator [Bryobacteraceae bacterium]